MIRLGDLPTAVSDDDRGRFLAPLISVAVVLLLGLLLAGAIGGSSSSDGATATATKSSAGFARR